MVKTSKKMAAIVLVVFMLPLLMAGVYTSVFNDKEKDAMLFPLRANGGEITDFVLQIPGNTGEGQLLFQWSLVTFDNGSFSARRNITFHGEMVAFSAMISPWVNTTNIILVTQGRSLEFEVQVDETSSPFISGQGFYDTLLDLTQNYPIRQTGTRGHYDAAEWMRAGFESYGYDSEIHHYRWTDEAAGIAGANPFIDKPISDILVISGMKPGEMANEWIVVGAHFDNAVGNRRDGEGAYDDGSGTALVVELAKVLAQVKTKRTFVFCGWGGEEEGLIGSERWANNEIPDGTKVVYYHNLDMVGISYPNPFPLHQQIGPNETEGIDHPEIWEVVENVTYEGMGWTSEDEDYLIIQETTGGGSDHTSFQRIGVPTTFNIGEWDYPYYHTPEDTLANMESYSGGKEQLINALDANAWFTLMQLLYLDNYETIR
jgi:hypothetical protein